MDEYSGPPPALAHLADKPVWVPFHVTPDKSRPGKTRKTPLDPHTDALAKINDSSTWGTWVQAHTILERGKASFIGLALTLELGQCWLDFDEVVSNGELIEPCIQIAQRFDTYIEWSLSGKGIHVAILGRKPKGVGCEKPIGANGAKVELFDHARFMIVTGREHEASAGELRDCQPELDQLCTELFPDKSTAEKHHQEHPPDKAAVQLLVERWHRIERERPEGVTRHDAALALAGWLLRKGWHVDRIKALLCAVADAAGCDGKRKAEWARGVDDTAGNLTNGKKVWGLPELAKAIGEHDVARLRDLLDMDNTEPFPLTNANAFFDKAPDARQFLLDRMLPAGEVSLLVGSGGTGKSFFAIQLALAVATGFALLGRINTSIPPSRVLYVSAEDRMGELWRRVHAVWRIMRMHEPIAPDGALANNLSLVSISGENVHLVAGINTDIEKTTMVDRLTRTIEAAGNPVLVILDPISRFYGADENSNSQRTAFVATVESISLATEAAILLVAHTSKQAARNGEISQDAARGGSALVDGVRAVWNLTTARPEDAKQYDIPEDDRHRFVRLDQTKSNYSRRLDTIWLERVEGGVLEATDITPSGEAKRESELAERARRVQNFLRERQEHGERLTMSALCKTWCSKDGPLGMSDKTFRQVAAQGCDRGWFVMETGKAPTGHDAKFLRLGPTPIPGKDGIAG